VGYRYPAVSAAGYFIELEKRNIQSGIKMRKDAAIKSRRSPYGQNVSETEIKLD